jgi:hypothetical protein
VLAEVQCYSVDTRGYYSQLREFNFLAELDLRAPLRKSIAESAHPVGILAIATAVTVAIKSGIFRLQELGFGDPSFNFKCYSANFLVRLLQAKSEAYTHRMQCIELFCMPCNHTGRAH